MALNIYQTLLKSLYIHSISSFNAYNNSISYVLLSSFYTWGNKAHKDRKTWVEPLRQAFKPRQPAVESSWEHCIELTLMKENNGCLVWGKIVALYQQEVSPLTCDMTTCHSLSSHCLGFLRCLYSAGSNKKTLQIFTKEEISYRTLVSQVMEKLRAS